MHAECRHDKATITSTIIIIIKTTSGDDIHTFVITISVCVVCDRNET